MGGFMTPVQLPYGTFFPDGRSIERSPVDVFVPSSDPLQRVYVSLLPNGLVRVLKPSPLEALPPVQVVANIANQTMPPREHSRTEEDVAKMEARKKAILCVYRGKAYQNYLQEIPRKQRVPGERAHPMTPLPGLDISDNRWDRLLMKWTHEVERHWKNPPSKTPLPPITLNSSKGLQQQPSPAPIVLNRFKDLLQQRPPGPRSSPAPENDRASREPCPAKVPKNFWDPLET